MRPLLRRFSAILQRCRNAVRALRGLPLHEEVAGNSGVRDVLAGLRPPGLDCPRCHALIVVDITSLLAKSTVYCKRCGLALKMSWQDDNQAKRALVGIQTATEELAKTRVFKK
jgi:hypothetical protein